MSYACYLDGIEMPIPAKLTVKIKGKNKTVVLLDEGEINFLRMPGLTELTVPFVFPMLGGAHLPSYYLDILEKLKTGKTSTQFILVRKTPDGKALYDTNMKVSVEDYSIVEDAKSGLDVQVDVSMKQWRDYGTKTVSVDSGGESVTVKNERDASTAPKANTHKVVDGDTLWTLAVKYYGDGAQYTRIYEANLGLINDPNLIYVGQELVIP